MNDRELLELAAKAAGHSLVWATDETMCWLNEVWEGQINTDEPWNPLRNDGDAMRLAVRLQIYTAHHHHGIGWVDVMAPGKSPIKELTGCDPYSAIRRAIVRAAAEIGRPK